MHGPWTQPLPGLDAAWHAALQAQAVREPLRPRVPLWWQGAAIGSVEPDFFDQIGLQGACRLPGVLLKSEQGRLLRGAALTPLLAQLAFALRDAGLAGAWRDEQLAVCDTHGSVLGTIERAAVRPLGIATRAVHLLAYTADGRQWVQQRAHDKPNDPGLWDTAMGGMVPACDTLEQALARESWEEAGLRPHQMQQLAWGGQVQTRRPSRDGAHRGYMVERIDWWRCVLPEGVMPVNQDGEVACFELLAPDALARRLAEGGFTLEAALVLAHAHTAAAQP